MNDFLALLGALGGFKAIEWIVTFFVNRKTNARKEDASADSMEIQNLLNIINNLTQQIERSDNRTKERDAKVDYVYGAPAFQVFGCTRYNAAAKPPPSTQR